MSNKKTIFIVILSILLLFGLSMVTATDNLEDTDGSIKDNFQDTAIDTNTNTQDSTDNIPDNTPQASDNNLKTGASSKVIQKDKKDIKTSKTVVITNQTFSRYFTEGYLNDNIASGDVLDFRGNFIGNYSMIINKAVNITSSTRDAYISLNTTANDWFGGDDVAAFTIIKSGAYTNVSHIYFYNSQIFVKGSHHIIFNNITAIVEDSTVGRGVGQTSIRDN